MFSTHTLVQLELVQLIASVFVANHVGEKADLLSVSRSLARVLRRREGQRRQEGDPPSEQWDGPSPQQSLHPSNAALLHLGVDRGVRDADGVCGRCHGRDWVCCCQGGD